MATCYDRYSRRYYTCRRPWNDWGRWVLFAVIVVAFILFFFLFRYGPIPLVYRQSTNLSAAVFQHDVVARGDCNHSTVLAGWATHQQVTVPPPTTLNTSNNLSMATHQPRDTDNQEDIMIKIREATKVTTVVNKPVPPNFSSHRMLITLVNRFTSLPLDLRRARMALGDEQSTGVSKLSSYLGATTFLKTGFIDCLRP